MNDGDSDNDDRDECDSDDDDDDSKNEDSPGLDDDNAKKAQKTMPKRSETMQIIKNSLKHRSKIVNFFRCPEYYI